MLLQPIITIDELSGVILFIICNLADRLPCFSSYVRYIMVVHAIFLLFQNQALHQKLGFILLQLHVWNDPLMLFFMLFVLCFAQNASDAQLTIVFVINLQKRYEDIPVLGQRPAEE
jgi:hypothetical protein